MNRYVKANADWLNCYDGSVEELRIRTIIDLQYPDSLKVKRILDVGCGSGRSSLLLHRLFPIAEITSIDINKDSIEYATVSNKRDNIKYVEYDIFDFVFDQNINSRFDLVFFSWSLFDTVSFVDQSEKYSKLSSLIDRTKELLNPDSCIIVTQPTKGGTFEKLLSRFMPDSDADYYITHQYLLDAKFAGPKEALPSRDEPLAIWSNFVCTKEQLYEGVSSILMLETGARIRKKDFFKELFSFAEKYSINVGGNIVLSDCVNMYYWKG